MIYESAGMMASLLGVSFEAFVLDDEMLSHMHRAIRGIEVDRRDARLSMPFARRSPAKGISWAAPTPWRPCSATITTPGLPTATRR